MNRDRPFTAAEYAQRQDLVRDAMDRHGLDLLIVTDPANMCWLTGYDAWSFYSHQAVVVGPEGEPLWWGRELDAAGAIITTRLPADHVLAFPEEHVQSPDRHPHTDLAEALLERGLGAGRIGVEMDAPYYTAAAHEALAQSLPGASFADATGLVGRGRGPKSPREIDLMRDAARIVEAMHSRILELIEPGLPQSELVAEIQRVGTRGIGGPAGDYPAIVPLLPSGESGSAPHLTWDERPFVAGEATFFEIAGCVRRYHAPLSRTVYLGDPPQRLRRLEDASRAGLEAGLEASRAGNRAGDVATAVFDAMAARGVDRGGRCGYPVGLGFPPDWGERTLSLRRSDDSVLEPGMTFHLMPVSWEPGAAVGITETILITPDGPAESITDFPRRLFTAGGEVSAPG